MTPPIVIQEQLLELAARCEAATGPDRELDCRIRCVVENLDFETCLAVVPSFSDWIALHYTASLDAAMTLVPDDGNHFPTITKFFNGTWEGRCYEQFSGERNQAIAATPALALCAAALKARAGGGQ